MDKKYKVYAHINKVNGKIYIGMTHQEPKRRFRSGFGYRHNKEFYSDIVKYGWDNFEHKIFYDNLTEEEALKKEADIINKYNSTNKEKGYNKSIGWIGFQGWKPSEEQKEKMYKIQAIRYKGEGNPFYGKHHDEEMRKKLSEIAKERFKNGYPEEMREKMRIANKGENNPFYGKHHSKETIEKLRARPKYMLGKNHTEETKKIMSDNAKGENNSQATAVIQYSLDYNFIREWNCMSDIENELKIKHSSVSNCCYLNYKNKLKNSPKKSYAKGFIWEYKQDPKQRKKVI